MNTPYGISQGFCVVTDVIYASRGMNVGAKNNDQIKNPPPEGVVLS